MLARRMLVVLMATGAVLLIHAGAASALPSEKIFFHKDDNCSPCPVSAMNADGSGVRTIPGGGSGFEASPNGTKIAYARDGSVFGNDIFVMNADGSGRTNLTNTPEAHEDDPSWSPDGTEMAYSRSYSDSNGGRVFEIWTMNADGSGQAQLTTGVDGPGDLGSQDGWPDWSPTGQRIAFQHIETTVRTGTDHDVWTMNADGSGLRTLTADDGRSDQGSPDWSPDGSKIAYDDNALEQTGQTCLGTGIFTMNADGSGKTRLTNKVGQACDAAEWRDDRTPQWSPGGGKIAFYSRPDIWTVNADGSGQARITNTPNGYETLFDWGLYDPPDTTKPVVSAPRPKPGSVTRDRTPTIGATVKDNLTNLSRDNITLRVAGNRVTTFAYDPATDKLTYTPRRLTKGKKTVSLAATDAALNVGTKSWSFTVR